MGDEMHQRNLGCSSLLLRTMAPELSRNVDDRSELTEILAFIGSNDQFFLNVAMALGKSMMDPVCNIEGSSVVTAMSRNGTDFGIRVSGLGDEWFTSPVEMPEGLYFPGFSAEDANGDTTDQTDDNLVRVTMSQGGDLNWASISVKISVDNGAPVTCDNPGATGGSCGLVEFGSTSDQVWSVGDGVTIVETGQSLCDAGQTCEIKVTITNTRIGQTIDETTSFAE